MIGVPARHGAATPNAEVEADERITFTEARRLFIAAARAGGTAERPARWSRASESRRRETFRRDTGES